ncbi:MAG: hypothetical protein M1379_12645 [Firmicutes bacterium]|nr:hypothetical protein [Bacillota bacterium]
MEESAEERDVTSEVDGIKFVMDPMSAHYLEGATIDYRESRFGAGFTIHGPETSSC